MMFAGKILIVKVGVNSLHKTLKCAILILTKSKNSAVVLQTNFQVFCFHSFVTKQTADEFAGHCYVTKQNPGNSSAKQQP